MRAAEERGVERHIERQGIGRDPDRPAVHGEPAATIREGAPNQLYIYTRASTTVDFSQPARHAELEVTADIASPTITNGGAVIYFHAGSPRDLYRATLQTNGTYTMPMPVTPAGMGKTSRGVELASIDDIDEARLASWMRQATALPGFGKR